MPEQPTNPDRPASSDPWGQIQCPECGLIVYIHNEGWHLAYEDERADFEALRQFVLEHDEVHEAARSAAKADCRHCEDAALSRPGTSLAERLARRMILCPECGNKRCPKATWHENACTGSNAPGQKGSDYGDSVT